MGCKTNNQSDHIEMVGGAGRVVVPLSEQAKYEGKGYTAIERTNLPLTNSSEGSGQGKESEPESADDTDGDLSDKDGDGEPDIMEVVRGIRSHNDIQAFMDHNNIKIEFEDSAKLDEKKDAVCEYISANSDQFAAKADDTQE